VLNEKERRTVAYHEMGHALVATAIPGSDPVHKISIIPRGVGALGYTIQRPTEDRFLMTTGELESKMAVLLGGRAAEHLVFDEISTGAADDLVKVTNIARSMVTRFGMTPSLGQVAYETEQAQFLATPAGGLKSRDFSEATAREIDTAVKDIVERAFARAVGILTDRRATLERGAQLLLQKETLTEEDLRELEGPAAAARAA
jgi:cell division protease FtsH